MERTGSGIYASHYYPKLGPYDSQDPNVVESHLLLMNVAGVDGVLIDWYEWQGTNGDIDSLLRGSNVLVAQIDTMGLEFGVVLEDSFAGNIDQTKAYIAYLRQNYFTHPSYIRDEVYFALQLHHAGTRVRFRNVEVRALP